MITTLNIHSRYDIETLARMVFKTQDVLNTEKERIRRSASLLKAAVLDSLSKVEVVLTLEDKESQKRLRSRIIAAGNDRLFEGTAADQLQGLRDAIEAASPTG